VSGLTAGRTQRALYAERSSSTDSSATS